MFISSALSFSFHVYLVPLPGRKEACEQDLSHHICPTAAFGPPGVESSFWGMGCINFSIRIKELITYDLQ